MPREGEGTGDKETPEKQVEALIIKNTSVAGMMLHKDSTHMLPISLAKSLRDQKLAIPVPKAIDSHPKPQPPPENQFEGESDDSEAAEEKPARRPAKSSSKEGGE